MLNELKARFSQWQNKKNLDNLSSEQFGKLVQGIKDKKIRINSWKGTVLMDLLEYTQQLIKNGDNSQRQQTYQLQAVLQGSPIKDEKIGNKNQGSPKLPIKTIYIKVKDQ